MSSVTTWRGRRALSFLSGAVAVALVAAACTGGTTSTPSPTATSAAIARGGVYRVGVTSIGLTGGFDPTGEYAIPGWALLDTMVRTLVTFKYAAGTAGTTPVPDLATSLPSPTDNGLTYAFHLKSGIKFGPPLDREITSQDVAYAFERINAEPLVAQYGLYYNGVIVGMTGTAKKVVPISGIETPDPQTIVFHLNQPVGDFLDRLTLPATGPIPEEVAKCFPNVGGYGHDVVSSGPYMMGGSQSVDPSSCAAVKPMSGFDPTKRVVLVRNPAYDPKTDTSSGRKAFVNAIDVQIDTSVTDIFNRVQSGDLDASWADVPPATVLQQYLSNPSLRPHLSATPNGNIEFLSMNMATPPFDDVHVRRAVNYIIDRAALRTAWGGPIAGVIATHIVPPYILKDQLTGSYNPYGGPGDHGSLAKAQAEMKLSKYDPSQDGMCDVDPCRGIVLVNRDVAPWTTMEPIVQADLAKIGIMVKPRELETGAAFNVVQTLKNRIPINMNADWAYDYTDAYTYLYPMFNSTSISAEGNPNTSLTGLTGTQAGTLGIPYPSAGVPSVDQNIATCEALSGEPRLQCWIGVDKYLMQTVVPYVPYLWSNVVVITGKDVTHFEADPISQSTSFTQVAVRNGLPVPSV